MHHVSYFLAALGAASLSLAHMEMIRPYALRSQYDPANDWSIIDYDNTSPLEADGSNFPCKNHHLDTPWRTVATYTAGQSDYMELHSGASHSGGSCQISLSYDNGSSFHVIQSYEGGCPLVLDWDFTIPSFAPSGQALFAWTWFNLVGNREMYMNCAQVEITGGSSDASQFNALPQIFRANTGNGCATVEGTQTVFKYPGANVGYTSPVTASSPAFPLCGLNAQ